MRHYYLLLTLAAVCLTGGFALGQSPILTKIENALPEVGWLKREEPQPPTIEPQPNAQDSPWEELLNRVLAMNDQAPDLDSLNKLQAMANSDAAVRKGLIERYDSESDAKAKYTYIQLLGGCTTADVIDFSSVLLSDADASRRKDGFQLLTDFLPDLKTFFLTKSALQKEKDPEVLRYAVAALRPRVVDPAENQSVISLLSDLAQHSDFQVRAQSLQILAQWDKVGTTAENHIYKALSDDQQEVRKAAIMGVVQGYSRSDKLKEKLFKIVGDTNESVDLRSSALRALEDFALNVGEYKAYDHARVEVEKLQHQPIAIEDPQPPQSPGNR